MIHLNFRTCYSSEFNNEKVESNIVDDMCCNLHEEADSKTIYHAYSITDPSNIIIKSSDIDILIMVGNMVWLKNLSSHIWCLTGNHKMFINVTKIYEELGELLTKSLVGFHAFTACDFNPAFFNKGKAGKFRRNGLHRICERHGLKVEYKGKGKL